MLPLDGWMTSAGVVGHLSSTTSRGEGGRERSGGSLVRMLSDRAGFSLAESVIFWWYLSIIRRMLGAVGRTVAVAELPAFAICSSARVSFGSAGDPQPLRSSVSPSGSLGVQKSIFIH